MIRATLALLLTLSLAGCEEAMSPSAGSGAKPGDEAAATPAGGTPPEEVQGQRWPPEGTIDTHNVGPVSAELEPGFDRPGYDIGQIAGLATPEQCRDACLDDQQCMAFTWVRAGIQGDQTLCWIKTQVAPQRPTEGMVSGFVRNREHGPH